MCGIAGWIDARRGEHGAAVRAMTARLSHRGPDGDGLHESGAVTLGHRRLSIIDVSERGHQPMTRGRHTVVFNGEIYNYVEIRHELERLGHRFSTGSDTEVLLGAYAEWGRSCTKRFDGMWAFALHDQETDEVFMSRDPFGEKPLLLVQRGDELVFASEVRALREGLGDLTADPLSLLSFLTLGRLPDATTDWYAGVTSLAPGHNLVVDLRTGLVETGPYLDATSDSELVPGPRADDARLDEVLERAVARRLRSDVPVGTLLSGGIDSSLLCAVAAPLYREMSGQPLMALTASSGDAANDESDAARSVAARSGATWERVLIDPVMDHDYLLDATRTLQQPLGSLSACLQSEVYRRAAGLGLKVVLDGQGADETWLGYPRHRFLAAREHSALTLPAQLARAKRHAGLSTARAAAMAAYFQFPTIPAARAARSLSRIGLPADRRQLRTWYRTSVGSGSASLVEAQSRELSEGQLQSLLGMADRNSMHWSLEVRLPYLSRELSTWGRSWAPQSLSSTGWSKHALRRALDRRGLPDIAWNTRKIGFEAHGSSFDPTSPGVRGYVARSSLVRDLGVDVGAVPTRLMWRVYALALWAEGCEVHSVSQDG